MALWWQNIVVFVAVGASAGFVGWQAFRSLQGKRSRLGSCCAKGCSANEAPARTSSNRVVFMPVEMLSRRK